jgi:hypothetical protein
MTLLVRKSIIPPATTPIRKLKMKLVKYIASVTFSPSLLFTGSAGFDWSVT